ncbi:MAG: hypothetical protein OEV91_01840 [Desulfobulbaceae bacterium]|nr:hypothetical protein [Desulfobulbaceae bacterium]
MHKWHIDGVNHWLCEECARQNAPLILRHNWEWVEISKDPDLTCDNCRCTDEMVQRHGRFRWLYCWSTLLLPWATRHLVLRRATK